jgi:hypothetical protein
MSAEIGKGIGTHCQADEDLSWSWLRDRELFNLGADMSWIVWDLDIS